MGFFDWITGSKSPAPGVPRQTAAELRKRLLAVNRNRAPFAIRDGAPEGCDLVAEWKIVDARWYEIFAKANLTKVFQILMKFDEAKGEVRALERNWTVEWRAGVPELKLSAEFSRGPRWEVSFGTAYAFTETGEYGQVYKYYFKSSEIKTPVQDVVAKAGWGWKSIVFGGL